MSHRIVPVFRTVVPLVVIVAISLGVWKHARRSDARSRVEASPAQAEFKGDDRNSTGLIEIDLFNRGARSAKLLRVTTSCGCTLPNPLGNPFLEAGGKTRLVITANPPAFGVKESVVTVETDSEETPQVRIPVRLFGRTLTPPYLATAPAEIRIETTFSSKPSARAFQVTCVESSGEPWLKGFKASSEKISLDVPKVVEEVRLDTDTVLRHYQTNVDLTWNPSSGESSDVSIWLTPLTRSEPMQPAPHIKVKVICISAIRAMPSGVVLSFHDDGPDKLSRQVNLLSGDDSPWSVSSVESSSPLVSVKMIEPEAGSRDVRLVLSAAKPMKDEGVRHSVVRIQTTHSRMREIVIPVVVRRGGGVN